MVSLYGKADPNQLEVGFYQIAKRLGHQNAKKAAANVTIIITLLLSNISDNFPIGHCDMAPEIASKKVTNDIWKIEKFIVVAYTASRVNNADWIVP